MMRLRFLVPVLGITSLCTFACSDDGSAVGGEGGAGGEPTVPVEGGGAGEGGEGGAACEEGRVGTLVIEVSGLPEGVAPELVVAGPDELALTESELTLDDVPSGQYTVTAARVFDADEIVRTVYDATVETESFCLPGGGEQTIKVTYEAIPSSNKLWLHTKTTPEGAGFSSYAIAESGLTDASVSIDGGIGKSIAFDRDGNLWTIAPTLDFPNVLRFNAADLGESGAPEPDVSFNVPEVKCLPALSSLALDPAGNVWLSACQGEVLRIPAASLSGVDGELEADVLLAGLEDNRGLAFDADGNLWVATELGLARYDASRLEESSADAPDLLLSVENDTRALRAQYLAFDSEGNLWGADPLANAVFKVDSADLTGEGEQEALASVSIAIGVTGILTQPAFDDGGGLWLGLGVDTDLDAGAIGRLSPAQLTTSAGPGAPVTPDVVVHSSSVRAELPLAFFPAAEGLPLYHALPTK